MPLDLSRREQRPFFAHFSVALSENTHPQRLTHTHTYTAIDFNP